MPTASPATSAIGAQSATSTTSGIAARVVTAASASGRADRGASNTSTFAPCTWRNQAHDSGDATSTPIWWRNASARRSRLLATSSRAVTDVVGEVRVFVGRGRHTLRAIRAHDHAAGKLAHDHGRVAYPAAPGDPRLSAGIRGRRSRRRRHRLPTSPRRHRSRSRRRDRRRGRAMRALDRGAAHPRSDRSPRQ